MRTPSEAETVQFVKDKLKTAFTGLDYTAFDHAHVGVTLQRFMETWVIPSPEQQESYKMPLFENCGIVHYTPKDGDSRPRYGWQAVLNGPLFESRKDFRSLRLARLWVKAQMKCKCWPSTTDTEQSTDPHTMVMSVTFDYDGPLDKARLAKNESFR